MKAHLAKSEVSRKELIRLLRQDITRLESMVGIRDMMLADLRKKRMSAVCRAKAFQKHYKGAKAQIEAVTAERNSWREAYGLTTERLSTEMDESLRLFLNKQDLLDELIAEIKRANYWCYAALASITMLLGLFISIAWG